MEIVSENHTHQDNSQITGGIDSPIHERPLPTLFTRTGYFILALIPVVAIFCSGARQAWSLSLTAGLMGISMLLISPVKKVPWVIWLPTSVAMLVGLSFALNIESLPPWRANLLSEFGVHTGTLQSPHPWISLERWLLGVLVILWLWFVISLGTREKDKRFILQVLTLGLSAVIACALYSKFAIVSPSHWQFDNGARFQFGPFPNRNHFSGVCAISGILSFVCVYDSIRRKTWTWPLFVLCLIVSFSAIILNTSRFGVLMFFFGCGTWMFSAALQDRSARKLAIFGSILLTGTTFILIFGQGILARFLKEGDLINTLANDGRSSIYQRTIEVLTETPWHGWSIGTFSQVFSLLDPNPNPHTRISHPESDLLWLAFEYGLPATILILVGIAFLVATFGPLKIRKERQSLTERGIRNAAAISALALLAQGVVDVPLHMLGIGVLAALLAGLGSNGHQKKRSLKIGDKRKTSKRFFWHYAAALYCFSCCYIWGSVHYGKPLFPTDTFARKLMSETIALAEKGHDAEALKHIEQVIDIRPLHWDAYFHRASIKLSLGYPHQQVLSDFSKARILEKNNVNVPFTEASIWENHNPQFALAAYSESMRRDPTQSLTYFHHIMNLVNRHPSLRYAAKSIARTNPSCIILI